MCARLFVGVLRCRGLLLVSPVLRVLVSMYFYHAAANLVMFFARCCHLELHRHYSLFVKGVSRFVAAEWEVLLVSPRGEFVVVVTLPLLLQVLMFHLLPVVLYWILLDHRESQLAAYQRYVVHHLMFSQLVYLLLFGDVLDGTHHDIPVLLLDGMSDDILLDPTILHAQLLAGVQTSRVIVPSLLRTTSLPMDRSGH